MLSLEFFFSHLTNKFAKSVLVHDPGNGDATQAEEKAGHEQAPTTARRSWVSSRTTSAVEPTRSQNITVSCASQPDRFAAPDWLQTAWREAR
jgi:hypothetical protein